MADKRSKQKSRASAGRYLALPKCVTDSEDFRGLLGSDLKTLLMIATQYNGSNNGDLQATFTLALTWGICSEQTLAKSIKRLIAANLIVRTRIGMFLNPGRKCSLYAITWNAIDECKGKLDVPATRTPPRAFSMDKNKKPSTEIVVTQYTNRSHSTPESPSQGLNEYNKCSHTNVFPIPLTTKTVDLNNLPRSEGQLIAGEQQA